jgi:hypothetical protein
MESFLYTLLARRAMPINSQNHIKLLLYKHDRSYKPSISIDILNGDIIPELYLDKYEFDKHKFRKWHLDCKFLI